MVRQAGRPGAPLRPESRGALVPSPSRSRAPSLSARAPPPGPLGAARRPGWGRCGALGRWRLRRRRRTPHSVGPLSCPRLRATSLRAGGRPARTPNRPSRLGAALRPSAPPCGPRRRAPLRSPRPAPLRSRPSARCPLRAAPCLARAFLGRPAGPLPGPSGFVRAPGVLRGQSRAGSALAPHRLLLEFRLGRATWLPAAPQAPDADTGFYLVRLSLPPLVRTAVAAAERHGPVAPAGHAPSVCRHLPLCGEHLESPCASVFRGEQGGERGTERRRERDWCPDCACASGLPPPHPAPAPAGRSRCCLGMFPVHPQLHSLQRLRSSARCPRAHATR